MFRYDTEKGSMNLSPGGAPNVYVKSNADNSVRLNFLAMPCIPNQQVTQANPKTSIVVQVGLHSSCDYMLE